MARTTRSMTALIQALDVVRTKLKQSDIPMTQLLTFAHVADRGEIPMQDLADLTGTVQSSVSRNVEKLGQGSPSNPGFGLVEALEDPYYRRRKLVRLTSRGKALAESIDAAVIKYLKSAA
jgi:DNA-binding MarR family transcriptional regulator